LNICHVLAHPPSSFLFSLDFKTFRILFNLLFLQSTFHSSLSVLIFLLFPSFNVRDTYIKQESLKDPVCENLLRSWRRVQLSSVLNFHSPSGQECLFLPNPHSAGVWTQGLHPESLN
jgi:hypothetical protein